MRLRAAALLTAALMVSGCGGGAGGEDAGDEATRDASGGECSPACEAGSTCVNGACVAGGVCGDGVVDPGEDCDDGNTAAFDGCENDCAFTCTTDDMCEQGDTCNGVETCSPESHMCVAGTPAADGDACPRGESAGICRGGECVEAGCGNGVVEGGEDCDDDNMVEGDGCENDCSFTCTADAECADTNMCNGVETCDLATHTCAAGTELACDDGDACTADSCVMESGCVNALMDEDGDGHAPDSLACGTDCNDLRADVNPDQAELCDAIDHDCDGTSLPSDTPTWFIDCDGDGYAAIADGSQQTCDEPAATPCGGGWTTTPPIGGGVDCDDERADVSPASAELAGDAADVDEDCDGAIACFVNGDGDGYRVATEVSSTDADCGDPGEAYAALPDADCDDAAAGVNPGAMELAGDASDVDENCDGAVACLVNADGDGYRTSEVVDSGDGACDGAGEARASLPDADCDDGDAAINPGAAEVFGDAGDVDEDCDMRAGCYANGDDDGYRTDVTLTSTDADCTDPGEAREALPSGDCLDTDASVHPGASEVDGDAGDLDENCDGDVTCYANVDGDGYRVATVVVSADDDCGDAGEARASVPTLDCLDTNASVHPGATEVAGDASNLDENCDRAVTCYRDADRDRYRTGSVIETSDRDCGDAGEAYASTASGDCDDGNGSIHPGASEVYGDAGDVDENCDGRAGCYRDADNDDYRTGTRITSSDGDCIDSGEARASAGADCCDADSRAHPGATTYYLTENNCRSFDYDCDRTEERRYPGVALRCCCTVFEGSPGLCRGGDGWTDTVPDCGGTGVFQSDCEQRYSAGRYLCSPVSSPHTQSCR